MHFPHTQRLSAKKVAQNFVGQKNSITFASHLKKRHDSVAQLVEQMTLNHWVESSSLSGVTKRGNSNRDFLFFVICPVSQLDIFSNFNRTQRDTCHTATPEALGLCT